MLHRTARRLNPRAATKTYLPVWRADGNKLGNLVNISTSGCLIFSSAPIELHAVIDGVLHVPWIQGFALPSQDVSYRPCHRIQVKLCPVWQQRDVCPRCFNLGCELFEVDQPELLNHLHRWIDSHRSSLDR